MDAVLKDVLGIAGEMVGADIDDFFTRMGKGMAGARALAEARKVAEEVDLQQRVKAFETDCAWGRLVIEATQAHAPQGLMRARVGDVDFVTLTEKRRGERDVVWTFRQLTRDDFVGANREQLVKLYSGKLTNGIPIDYDIALRWQEKIRSHPTNSGPINIIEEMAREQSQRSIIISGVKSRFPNFPPAVILDILTQVDKEQFFSQAKPETIQAQLEIIKRAHEFDAEQLAAAMSARQELKGMTISAERILRLMDGQYQPLFIYERLANPVGFFDMLSTALRVQPVRFSISDLPAGV